MTDTPKKLGAIVSTTDTNVLIYTVPSDISAIVSTIFVCNRGVDSTTFRLAHVVNGEISSLSNKDYLYYDITIMGNDTFATTSGISMSAGDSLVGYSSNDNLSFTAHGLEITTET